MESSFTFKTSLNEWGHYLRDINFWLNGYLNSPAYRNLEQKLDVYMRVHWNIGVGPTSCFTKAISSIIREVKIRKRGPFDPLIEVDMKQAAVWETDRLDINDKLHMKVAEQLGILKHNKYDMVDADELRYYTYGIQEEDILSLREIKYSIAPQIMQHLWTKKYLLMIENLDEPINPIKLGDLPEGSWFPPTILEDSFWIVSTTSQDVFDRSKPGYDCVIKSFTGDDILILTLYSLKQARYISGAIGHEDEKYWHHVALQCFHYTTMLLIPGSSRVDPSLEVDAHTDVRSSENLIRLWAAQGILPVMNSPSIQRRMGKASDSYHNKYYGDDVYQVGNVILEAFQEYSLLHLPFSPATKDDEAIKSAAHFLAYHCLIVEPLTLDELCEASQSQLEHIRWVSHVSGDQGWHLSRDWLSEGASGPSSLIIKHCSKQSTLFMKLQSDHFLAKLPCLRVLDLSYTPLESLPPSICCLQKLHWLSLKGCYNLSSPLSFPNPEFTLCENNTDKKLNLLYLDLSYSNIKEFHCNFFQHMPNLTELLLVKCSNLEELPTSAATLSTLIKLELTGSQIKSLSGEMFEEMKNLQSLKLVDNRKLLLAPGLVSKASSLIDLHIEGHESITEVEINLKGHPTLRSFSLVGTPHIKRLSLHGCRKLESVDIKDADALEELDLSATAITELPESVPNLPRLRRLLLVGVPSLRRFPWHKLQRLPDVFCLDQCSDGTGNHPSAEVAQVRVCDSRLFYSFNDATKDLVAVGKLLKSFCVRVTSCKAATRKQQDEEHMVITNKPQVSLPAYADVHHHYLVDEISMDDVPPIRETECHIEISTVDRYPHGLQYLLQVTKSIFMSDDSHVSCLNDLSVHLKFEKCMLQRCHQMVHVFNDVASRNLEKSLKNSHVSNLKRLTHFYIEPGYQAEFHALMHLRLEHCPRLEGIMPRSSRLPSLVTLDVLFCYNIKAIFYDDGESSSHNYYSLKCLRRIHLQELPLLEHLHVDNPILTAPAWEELHVRGCWSLRRLPRLDEQPDKAVKVSGERAWWTKLQWDRDDGGASSSHRSSYEPRLPPVPTSFGENVVIKTYLR